MIKTLITPVYDYGHEFKVAVQQTSSFAELGELIVKHLKKRFNGEGVSMATAPITTGGEDCPEHNLHRLAWGNHKLAIQEGHNVFDHVFFEVQMKKLMVAWRKSNSGYCWPLIDDCYARIITEPSLVRVLVVHPNTGQSLGSLKEQELARKQDIPRRLLSPAFFADMPPFRK